LRCFLIARAKTLHRNSLRRNLRPCPANERFNPADADETYRALADAVRILHKFKRSDDFSRAVTLTTRASGFSWGANMSASVIPHDQGAIVRVGGEAKVRTNITGKGAEASASTNYSMPSGT
jgi:hypothetical protein